MRDERGSSIPDSLKTSLNKGTSPLVYPALQKEALDGLVRFGWLNNAVAICLGVRAGDSVLLDGYLVE